MTSMSTTRWLALVAGALATVSACSGGVAPPKTSTSPAVPVLQDCRLLSDRVVGLPCRLTSEVAGRMIVATALDGLTLTQAPPPPTTSGPAASFNEGVYEVGVEIQPGKYKSPGGTGCYWARLGEDPADIIDNNLTDGPSTVIVKSGDSFVEFSGCVWTLAP